MTKADLDAKIQDISGDSNVSPEEKTRRIDLLNSSYANQEKHFEELAAAKQQHANESLKDKLRTAYLANPAATPEDFENDFPALRSEHLRNSALQADAVARGSQERLARENF